MNKNIKLLTIGLLLFALSLILKAIQMINTTLSNLLVLVGFGFIVVALYHLVFTKLRKK